MKKTRDTSLQIRLASIAILGLLIALAAAAYRSGRQVQSDGDLIAQDAVPGTIDAHYMRMAVSRSIGWVLVAASAKTPEAREKRLETVHDADAAFNDAIQQYETTIRLNPVKDRALLEEVKRTYAEFRTQRLVYETLIADTDRDAAAAFLEHKLVPTYLPAIKAAEDLLKYNHGNSISLSTSIRSSVNQLYWAVAVVMVLALACAVVLVFNLTLRRRELEELRESEEKFSKAFLANPSGIAITEIETGRYIEVNDSFCKILGYPPEEVIGYTTLDKGVWTSEEERSRILQPLLMGGRLHNQEVQTRTRYGARKTLSLNAEVIELAGRRCIMTLIEDITERKRATEQIELLKVSIDKHFDAAYWMDSNNRFVYVNDSACSALGYAREELLGQSVAIIAPTATPQGLQEVWGQLRETGFFTRESRHRRKDGSEFPVEIVASYVRFEGKEFNCGFARDITGRKQLESKQAQLASIVESSEDGIIGKTLEGVITSWNRGAEKIFGYTAAEVIGQPLLRLFPPERQHEEAEILAKSARGETVQHFDTVRVRKDGRKIFISATISPLRDGTGEVIGSSKIARDITSQREAEQELRWRTAFFEAQVYSAIDGILVVDSAGKKLLQNRRMNELWKIPPLIAEDSDDSKQVQFVLGRVREPEVFAKKLAHLNAHPDESSSDVIEQVDGTLLERYSAPVRGSDGRYYGRVWTFHDITERKKLEAQFLRAQRMESVGTLASGVAHDLNNILTPIMMSMAVLRMKISDEKRASLFDTIEASALRGAQIVKQVLTFGRGLDGEKHPLQLEMLIQEVEQMIRSTFPKDITVENAIEPQLWLVLGDATQLHQVLLNLCVNARDAMPTGGRLRLSATNLDIDVSYASMLPEIAPGPHVLLEVNDTGSGIPPEILERIFDPFFTTKGVGKGTGLGLSTVHGIVKGHGGLLKVVSAPGKGTTFQIYLPAAPAREATADADSLAPPPTGHGELVLVVDDESAIADAARTVLEANGYRVLLASDGAEALAVFSLNSNEIAVVLTDVMMPVMNGVLFLRTLRKMSVGVPVIGSTGLAEKKHLDELKTLNIASVLRKPYNADMLLRTLHGVLHS
ncbi:MAG: hypothetical protein JWR15_3679 [Prosthecobacter sp.]|nr:hypothetical protein [Prosthecobacter sp.]